MAPAESIYRPTLSDGLRINSRYGLPAWLHSVTSWLSSKASIESNSFLIEPRRKSPDFSHGVRRRVPCLGRGTAYKYRFFNCGRGKVPALDVFAFCDDPS